MLIVLMSLLFFAFSPLIFFIFYPLTSNEINSERKSKKGKTMKHIFILLILLSIFGCSESKPDLLNTYNVKLVSPNGTVIQEWNIESASVPHKLTKWGGQTRIIDTKRTGRIWWESDIVAPEGYCLVIKKKDIKNARP